MILDESAFAVEFETELPQNRHADAKVAEGQPRENTLHSWFVEFVVNANVVGEDESANQTDEKRTVVELMVGFGGGVEEEEEEAEQSEDIGVEEDDDEELLEVQFLVGPDAGEVGSSEEGEAEDDHDLLEESAYAGQKNSKKR